MLNRKNSNGQWTQKRLIFDENVPFTSVKRKMLDGIISNAWQIFTLCSCQNYLVLNKGFAWTLGKQPRNFPEASLTRKKQFTWYKIEDLQQKMQKTLVIMRKISRSHLSRKISKERCNKATATQARLPNVTKMIRRPKDDQKKRSNFDEKVISNYK